MAKTKFIILVFLSSIIPFSKVSGQLQHPAWYIVHFTDKKNTEYSLERPLEYLSQRAIDRRSKAGINIDSSDLPVNKTYIDSIREYSTSIGRSSKWLNATLVSVYDTSELSTIINLPFVKSAQYMVPYWGYKSNKKPKSETVSRINTSSNISYNKANSYTETRLRFNMNKLGNIADMGYHGKGIHIALFDEGFFNVDSLDAFQHLFENSQILGVENFTSLHWGVFETGTHGTSVLSTMAAIVDNKFLGSAPEANYFLFITEDFRYEYPIEESNWLFAAEYSDSAGVDIISSSLGYYHFDNHLLNYNHSYLDGKTTIISKAAKFATEKGILVFNSAGNLGDSFWRKISFPADVDGVLAVGAVNDNAIVADFSSEGLTADGRIKPDIASHGDKTAVLDFQGSIIKINGTSFSTPFIAGAAACLMQALPNKTAKEIRDIILKSSSQYYTPDSLIGYGIPDFYLSYLLNINDNLSSFKESEIIALPNPFNESFHIIYNSITTETADINIHNLEGKLIWSESNISIQKGKNLIYINGLFGVCQGLYFINISSKSTNVYQKIIKN